MSLLDNLGTAVNGLDVQSKKMRTISSNIANVETTGYKAQKTAFHSLVLGDSGRNNAPRGVSTTSRSDIYQQGSMRSTDNDGDLAVSGSGFLLVRRGTEAANPLGMMRTGSFRPDKDGRLVNEMGYVLQGTMIPAAGEEPIPTLANMVPVQIPTLLPVINREIVYEGELNSISSSGEIVRQTMIKDSLGNDHEFTLTFQNEEEGQWDVSCDIGDSGTVNLDGVVSREGTTWNNLTDGTVTATITWADETLPNTTLTLNLGGIGGNESSSSAISAPASVGVRGGSIVGWNIAENGVVDVRFPDGSTLPIYRLPLATCTCPPKLLEQSGGVYFANNDSGPLRLSSPDKSGAGSLCSGSLESSTVDIAQELSDMITTQYAYSANTKIISTVSQMLDSLIRL
jgi:flagellar hook protein FlgE